MKKCLKCKECSRKLVKCQLCEKDVQFEDTLTIKNRVNGNKLRICKKCGKEFNWIQ